MDKTNHPIDNLFSKGIEGFQIEPSLDVKKKVFATPALIKPVKPWYAGFNGALLAFSVVATASLIVYFGLFNNIEPDNTTDINNEVSINSNSQNNIVQNQNTNNKKEIIVQSNNNLDKENVSNAVSQNNNIEINNVSNNTEKIIAENKESNQKTNVNLKNENFIEKNKTEKNSVQKTETGINSVNIAINEKSENSNIQNKQIKDKENSKIEDLHTNNLITENKSTNIVTTENKVTDTNNNSQGSNINSSLNLLPISNVNADYDKSMILFFMEKRTIILSSQQMAEYMKLFAEKPAHYKKGLWFAEIKAGAILSKYKVSTKDDEWKPASDAKQEILRSSIGCDLGVNAVYQQNKFIFKGGLSYVNYCENLSGNLLLTNPHNSEQINFVNNHYETIINGNYYDIDTLGSYTHYTYTQTYHIFASDSTTAYNTQNVLVDMYDTTNVTNFDTIPKTTIINSIRYFEIPLSVGYVLPMGRFNLALNANISPGYFLAVRGSQMNATDYPALEPYQTSTLKKFTFSAGVSFELGYMLNESLTLIAEPYYKKSLLPMYSSKNKINQTNQNFGFRVGIRKLL